MGALTKTGVLIMLLILGANGQFERVTTEQTDTQTEASTEASTDVSISNTTTTATVTTTANATVNATSTTASFTSETVTIKISATKPTTLRPGTTTRKFRRIHRPTPRSSVASDTVDDTTSMSLAILIPCLILVAFFILLCCCLRMKSQKRRPEGQDANDIPQINVPPDSDDADNVSMSFMGAPPSYNSLPGLADEEPPPSYDDFISTIMPNFIKRIFAISRQNSRVSTDDNVSTLDTIVEDARETSNHSPQQSQDGEVNNLNAAANKLNENNPNTEENNINAEENNPNAEASNHISEAESNHNAEETRIAEENRRNTEENQLINRDMPPETSSGHINFGYIPSSEAENTSPSAQNTSSSDSNVQNADTNTGNSDSVTLPVQNLPSIQFQNETRRDENSRGNPESQNLSEHTIF